MKILTSLIAASSLQLSLPAFAADAADQSTCLEAASASLATAQKAADDKFAAATLRCRTMPNVDVLNACVNDAFDALAAKRAAASAVYASDVAACLR
jgi:hypothetical protein